MRNRRRDARHPIVVGTMVSFVVISTSQLFFGPVGSTVVLDMAHWSQRLFALILLTSALECLASAVVKREPRGAKLERLGMFGCAVALLFYAHSTPTSIPSWNTSMAFGYLGIGIMCAVRAGLVWRMIQHEKRERPAD